MTAEEKHREENGEKTDENSGHYAIASSRPADRWNAAHSCQLNKTQVFSVKLQFNTFKFWNAIQGLLHFVTRTSVARLIFVSKIDVQNIRPVDFLSVDFVKGSFFSF